jgi:spore coat protein U-like protein
MKKSNVAVGLSVALLIGGLLTPNLSLAGTKSQNMPVQAQVNANCNFTSSNTMDFGSTYDPSGANLSNPLGGAVVVDVRCTKGASVSIGINTGANGANAPAGSTRAMKFGTNYLGYDFYQESTYATLWTNSGAGMVTFISPSNAPNPVTVYGKVPGGQDVPAGLYQDTVIVTVNY